MSDIQPENLESLVAALRQGDQRGAAINAATSGFNRGQDRSLEQRKLALQQKMEDAGLAVKQRDIAAQEAGTALKFEEAKNDRPILDATGRTVGTAKGIKDLEFVPGQGAVRGPGYQPGQEKPTVLPQEPGATRNATKMANDVSALNEIALALNDMTDNYDPSFVGATDKFVTGAKQMTGIGASTKASNFRTGTATLRNAILHARSGGAVTPSEAQRLIQELPDEGFSDADFESRLGKTVQKFQTLLQSRKALYGAAGNELIDINPFQRGVQTAPATGAPSAQPQQPIGQTGTTEAVHTYPSGRKVKFNSATQKWEPFNG